MSTNRMSRAESLAPGAHPTSDGASTSAGMLVRIWWQVLWHPAVATFNQYRASASWRVVWLSLLPLAVVEALGVVYAVYGPDAAAGYSSLPVGPKLHLSPTPLLPLAVFIGSPAQFFVFSRLLYLSARLFGGRGSFKTQTYLMALFWVPLMIASGFAELIPVVGSALGLLIRSYALVLCVPAIAAANALSLRRALAALLVVAGCGLLLGLIVLIVLGPHLQSLLGMHQ